jgi:glycosyltransferase involved in cell wall biosynthesis
VKSLVKKRRKDHWVKDFIKNMKSDFTAKEGDLLRRLACDVSLGCIVTVGSSSGTTAMEFRAGISECRKDSTPPQIFCVEPHHFFSKDGGNLKPRNKGSFFETFFKTNAFNDIALIDLSSEEVAPLWRRPVGLLVFSSNYHHEDVMLDFESWDPFLIPGGIIVFCNTKTTKRGSRSFIDDVLSNKDYAHVDTVGKVVVLKKTRVTDPLKMPPLQPARILIACHDIVTAGGLLRFERVGRVLKSRGGHELAFVVLSETPKPKTRSAFPVLSYEQAEKKRWDAVMIPGAAFPNETIERFSDFKKENFGVRVQHILNDQKRLKQFEKVNKAFSPNIVIFNNTQWPAGSFTQLKADRFHFLLGGIDLYNFRPSTHRTHPVTPGSWVVGGLANKNPKLLIEALKKLPSNVKVRLFGKDKFKLLQEYQEYIEQGRLELIGVIEDNELQNFYKAVDCVVMTEEFAGWANIVVEAMASGVPAICTPHGTNSFSFHNETALVIDSITPSAIAESIELLMGDEHLCRRLTESAQKVISANGTYPWSWENYTNQLLRLIRHDGLQHYYHAPELGIYGKWPLDERMKDLHTLLEKAMGLSIIDFGAAEGIIAREFLKKGAALVHGFELDPYRVAVANTICSDWKNVEFRSANLSEFETFYQSHSDLIADEYDIVLYLGLHHHLPKKHRKNTLMNVISLTRRYIAIRTTEKAYRDDHIDDVISDRGFEELKLDRDFQPNHLGICKIYERINQ